ncbi:uncharacterized protein BT62DRAFT_1011930 [Guyanagaster necrorhizus]|uniref:Uncharacterized protein n=1 Tax=Guyanagaster necrorhizus TaxID=856835 RepID=A0A9P7VIC5_9AGAR|nr:uncharacterized protein BT62DRAFT_1011930 [Guyanagaster necrorhizus MCA 3950]KAG7441128.1 hypothetical protein BT62DRAFT_1011930 [Guyanagaster necrorhizus MCA 3950]
MGFRVVAPTMLGYGDTNKPVDPSEYTTKKFSWVKFLTERIEGAGFVATMALLCEDCAALRRTIWYRSKGRCFEKVLTVKRVNLGVKGIFQFGMIINGQERSGFNLRRYIPLIYKDSGLLSQRILLEQ